VNRETCYVRGRRSHQIDGTTARWSRTIGGWVVVLSEDRVYRFRRQGDGRWWVRHNRGLEHLVRGVSLAHCVRRLVCRYEKDQGRRATAVSAIMDEFDLHQRFQAAVLEQRGRRGRYPAAWHEGGKRPTQRGKV
jgi:hypothetical protein